MKETINLSKSMTTSKSRSIDYTAMEGNKTGDIFSNGNGKVNMDMQTYVEKKNDEDKHSDEGVDEPCGWIYFKPSVFQKFRDPKWVLFFLCWAGAVQVCHILGIYSVYEFSLYHNAFYRIKVISISRLTNCNGYRYMNYSVYNYKNY